MEGGGVGAACLPHSEERRGNLPVTSEGVRERKVGKEKEGEDGLEKGKVKAARTRLWFVGLSFPICTLDAILKTGLIGRSNERPCEKILN